MLCSQSSFGLLTACCYATYQQYDENPTRRTIADPRSFGSQLQSDLKKVTSECVSLKDDLSAAQLQIQELESKLLSAKSECATAIDQRDALVAETKSIQELASQRIQAHDIAQEQRIAELQASFQRETNIALQKAEQLAIDLEDARKASQSKDAEIQTLLSQLAEVKSADAAKETSNARLACMLEQCTIQVQREIKHAAHTLEEFKSYQLNSQRLQAASDARIQILEAELKLRPTLHDIHERDAKIESLEAERDLLQEDATDLALKVESFSQSQPQSQPQPPVLQQPSVSTEQFAELQLKFEQLEHSKLSLENDKRQLESLIDTLNHRVSEMAQQISSLSSELTESVATQLAQIVAERDAAITQIDALQASLEVSNEQCTSIKAELATMAEQVRIQAELEQQRIDSNASETLVDCHMQTDPTEDVSAVAEQCALMKLKVMQLESEKLALHEQVESMQKLISDYEANVKHVTLQQLEAQTREQSVADRLAQTTALLETTQADLANVTLSADQAKQVYEESERRMASMVESLESSKQAVVDERDRLLDRIKETESQVSQLTLQLNEAIMNTSKFEADHDVLIEDFQSVSIRLTEIEASYKDAVSERDASIAAATQARDALDTITSECDMLKIRIDDLDQQRLQTLSHNGRLEADLVQANKEIDRLTGLCNEAAAELELKQDRESEIRELHSTQSTLESAMVSLEQELTKVVDEMQEISNQANEKELQLAEASQQVTLLEARLAHEAEQSTQTRAVLEEHISSMRLEHASLTSEFASLESRADDLQRKLEESRCSIRDLETTVDEREARVREATHCEEVALERAAEAECGLDEARELLQEQKHIADEQIKQLQLTIDEQAERIAIAERDLNTARESLEQLSESQIKAKTPAEPMVSLQTFQQLEAELETLKTEHKQYLQFLTVAQEEIIANQAEIEREKQRADLAQTSLEQVKEERASLSETVLSLRSEVVTKTHDFDAALRTKLAFEKHMAVCDEERARIGNQLGAILLESEDAKHNFAKLKSLYEESKKELEVAHKTISEQSCTINELKYDIESHKSELSLLQADYDKLISSVNTAKSDMASQCTLIDFETYEQLSEQCADLKQKLEDGDRDRQDRTNALQLELDRVSQKTSVLQDDLSASKSSAAMLETEKTELQSKIDKLEQLIVELQQQVDKAQAKQRETEALVEQQLASLQRSDESVSALNAKVCQLEESLQQDAAAKIDLERQLTQIASDRDAADQRLIDAMRQHDQLKAVSEKKLDDLRQELGAVQSLLSAAQDENTRLQDQIQAAVSSHLQHQSNDSVQQLQKVETRLRELEASRAELQESFDKLETEFQTKSQENDDLQVRHVSDLKEIDSLRTRLTAVKAYYAASANSHGSAGSHSATSSSQPQQQVKRQRIMGDSSKSSTVATGTKRRASSSQPLPMNRTPGATAELLSQGSNPADAIEIE
eukprot:jgi/Hompol1/6219/HPOL_004892-RA